jgi:hypothetical protein
MKYIIVFILLILSGCNKKSVSVKIEKYDLNMNAPSFVRLPSGVCETKENILFCKISPDTKIKWGTGFCENTKEALHARVEKSEIVLLINGRKIEDSNIFSHEEVYTRDSFQYCHEWHVLLSNWQEDSTLVAMDLNKYTDEIRVTLEK